MPSDVTDLPSLIFEESKTYHLEPQVIEALTKDVAELEKLGFEIPAIRMRGANAVQYDLSPPKKESMGVWRQRLEKAGFEVVSRLKQDQLGFSATRRAVQGEGWK